VTRLGQPPALIPEGLLAHRGPDHTEQIVHGSIALRHWRLSIVDLSSGANQPVANDRYAFAFNGEIYDYEAISRRYFQKVYKSDTQLLFDLLAIGETEKIKNASGFYAYVRVDKIKLEIVGARDFWGKKPLYYYVDDERAIFASEETAIRTLCTKKPAVNARALMGYALYKNFHFGDTCFEGVHELPPGGNFSFDVRNWKLNTSPDWDEYYQTPLQNRIRPDLLDDPPATGQKVSEYSLIEAIQHALELRYHCDVPVQLALSGGVDSTAIAAISCSQSELRKKLLKALTVEFSHDKDESKKAASIARQLHLAHEVVEFPKNNFLKLFRSVVRAQGAPLEHPHSMAYFALCSAVSESGRVLITGEGADEIFFGYSHYHNGFSGSFAFRPFLEIERYFDGDTAEVKNLFNRELALREEALTNPLRSRDLEIKTHLISLLRRNDRTSMAKSVEIRAPFLDIGLLYRVLVLSDEKFIEGRKTFLSQYIKKRLPNFQTDSEKIGFHVPFDAWFKSQRESDVIYALIIRASQFFFDQFGLKLRSNQVMDCRLGWVLCNIGLFMEEFEKNEF
jgi:asparagine synthase (glutamine-hydrolysing)